MCGVLLSSSRGRQRVSILPSRHREESSTKRSRTREASALSPTEPRPHGSAKAIPFSASQRDRAPWPEIASAPNAGFAMTCGMSSSRVSSTLSSSSRACMPDLPAGGRGMALRSDLITERRQRYCPPNRDLKAPQKRSPSVRAKEIERCGPTPACTGALRPTPACAGGGLRDDVRGVVIPAPIIARLRRAIPFSD